MMNSLIYFTILGTTITLFAVHEVHASSRRISDYNFRDVKKNDKTDSISAKTKCKKGEYVGGDGLCEKFDVVESIYYFQAPRRQKYQQAPIIPPPKIEENVIYIKTADLYPNQEPIIVPPTQSKTIVYVLNKNKKAERQIIEIPDIPQSRPEVFYVNYNDEDDPLLPDGSRLKEILSKVTPQPGFVKDFSPFAKNQPLFVKDTANTEIQSDDSEENFVTDESSVENIDSYMNHYIPTRYD